MIPGGGRVGARRLLLLTLLTAGPGTATGQEPAPASDPNPNPRAFIAADVSMGAVLIQDAEPGIGFTVGADVSNLILKGFSTRFAFRLWASEHIRPLAVVELDDFSFGIMQRLYLGEPGFAVYGGLGLSLHIVSARIRGTDLTAPRNGLRPGVDMLFGLEIPLAEEGFIRLFGDATGSFVPDISQAWFQVGIRLRFDSLPDR